MFYCLIPEFFGVSVHGRLKKSIQYGIKIGEDNDDNNNGRSN